VSIEYQNATDRQTDGQYCYINIARHVLTRVKNYAKIYAKNSLALFLWTQCITMYQSLANVAFGLSGAVSTATGILLLRKKS